MYSIADLSLAQRYSALYIHVYVICDFKLCVNFIGVENGARLTARDAMGRLLQHLWGKNSNISTVDQKHGTRVDGYLCLCLHTHVAQVGILWHL
jgi:hypothetical protein